MNGASAIHNMEIERLDQEIEKTRKQFYGALLGKKRRVKRKWLEISAMTNAHLLQTLPYRAMLGHVAQLAEERDKLISEILKASSSEKATQEGCDDNSQGREAVVKKNDSGNDEGITRITSSKSARDEAIQTEESSFLPSS